MNDFTIMIENNDFIDVIYLDLSKAFVAVPHCYIYYPLRVSMVIIYIGLF